MTNEKLIKNLCENELEKVSGGYGLGDYAKEHPFLTFFGATFFVVSVLVSAEFNIVFGVKANK